MVRRLGGDFRAPVASAVVRVLSRHELVTREFHESDVSASYGI